MGSAWRIGASSQLIHARMTTAWTCLVFAHDPTWHRLARCQVATPERPIPANTIRVGFELHEPANVTLLLRSAL